ncbi:TPA: HNH endonuclease [Citrobacter freundii]|nr:HNH endonuclease signature motif containing protein [Citrobacter freundii]EIN8657340.1 HNH endonuclease [Citrobacter freundii]HBZ9067370.1 HNH endonuclease [Citrobacter freundii]HBZ9266254.1 HNH endonuclease [Citrobacter freundii]HBZ9383042.1 HNH endonuclease [Citrobacter freundii]HBZ9646601.1 HNH endonuclease [Citrobacter freundii]
MIFGKQKTSESILKMRAVLERDVEANTEGWSELVEELIPENKKQEWKNWLNENIKKLLEEGFEKQSEILIHFFLSSINKNSPPLQSEQNEVDTSRRYGEAEIRDGQTKFSLAVRENCCNKCVVTGCCVGSRLQAAHIIPHNRDIDYSVSNGLLLRADIHLMLDSGDCAIDPINKKIYFKQSVMDMDSDLENLHGKSINGFKTDINWSGFEEGWNKYNKQYT